MGAILSVFVLVLGLGRVGIDKSSQGFLFMNGGSTKHAAENGMPYCQLVGSNSLVGIFNLSKNVKFPVPGENKGRHTLNWLDYERSLSDPFANGNSGVPWGDGRSWGCGPHHSVRDVCSPSVVSNFDYSRGSISDIGEFNESCRVGTVSERVFYKDTPNSDPRTVGGVKFLTEVTELITSDIPQRKSEPRNKSGGDGGENSVMAIDKSDKLPNGFYGDVFAGVLGIIGTTALAAYISVDMKRFCEKPEKAKDKTRVKTP